MLEISNNGTIDFLDMQKMNADTALSYGINSLLLIREGTLPGSRNFGLKQEFLSAPSSDIALNILGTELQEKMDIYIEDVDVESVRGEADVNGHLNAIVSVERR